jgi:hypothetical protein
MRDYLYIAFVFIWGFIVFCLLAIGVIALFVDPQCSWEPWTC